MNDKKELAKVNYSNLTSGQDDESKKSLIDEFKQKVDNSDINYYSDSVEAKKKQSQTGQSRCQFWNDLSKKQKMILIIGAALLLIVIIIVIIVTSIKHSSNPDNPPPPVPDVYFYGANPYYLSTSQSSQDGGLVYTLKKDRLCLTSSNISVTADNQYIESVQIKANLLSYETLRLQITDQSNPNQYRVPDSYLSSEYLKNQQQGLNFSLSGFKIGKSPDKDLGFGFQLLDNTDKVFLDSFNQNFVIMSSYQEIGFTVDATYFYGLGERFSNFSLNEGSYTLFPYFSGKPDYDTGKTVGNELYGQHPFLMMKLKNGKFMGIFLFNSNPQQFRIQKNSDSGKYQVNIITTGGVMDLFIFKGPTYANVVRQYQNIIGNPKMLPLWAHAFQSRSSLYTDQKLLDAQVYNYTAVGLKVEVLGLPIQAMYNQTNFQTIVNTANVRDEGLEVAMPYFYFVPDNENNQQTVKNLLDNNLTIQIQQRPLQVTLDGVSGYCVDYFNPSVSTFIKQTLLGQNYTKMAFWLEGNTPFFDSFNGLSGDQPFDKVPYLPFNRPFGQSSIPAYAQHIIDSPYFNPKFEYHYNLHGLYGTQMAKVLSENLPANSFVISSSTFPGSGKMGIAHQLPMNEATWQNLRFSLNNLLNFHMFGIPYTGHNICGYSTPVDEQLCVRSFQLSVISPLAILNQNSKLESDLPYKLSASSIKKIQLTLIQRLSLLIYQRTELYKISRYGGVLAQPLSVVFSDEVYLQNHTRAIEFIMYGNAIKADYLIGPDVDTYDSYFPTDFWMSLRSSDVLINKTQPTGYITTQSGNNPDINLYQKPGTIIPFVGSNYAIDRVNDLGNSPLHLSILIDQATGSARGQVLLESGKDLDYEREFYEIVHEHNLISFKQQNNGSYSNQNNKNVDLIKLTGTKDRVDFACVLKKDLKSTQILYVKSFRDTPVNQTELQPIRTQQDQTKLWIDEIAFIFYSSEIVSCIPELFKLSLIDKPIQDDNTTYYAQIKQNLKTVLDKDNSTSKFYDVYLNITLLSDNSVYIFFAKNKDDHYTNTTPTRIYDRKFSQFASEKKTIKLKDILIINADPFYIDIIDTKQNIVWSTQYQIHVFHDDFHIFSYISPYSKPDRFFGLPERKGQFFLQDKYTYSLYTNNEDIADKYQAQGSTIQHGKNGAHPVVFSQYKVGTNLMAYVSFIPSGVDFLFNKNVVYRDGPNTRVAHISPQTLVESVFIFDLNPQQMTQALFKHINLGDLYTNQQANPQKTVGFPPDMHAFGFYAQIKNFNNFDEIKSFIELYADKQNYPLEGIMMEDKYLDGFESLTFNSDKFIKNGVNEFLNYLQSKTLTFFQSLKSGLSKSQLSDAQLKKFDKFVKVDNTQPFIGQDQTGNIQFLDHSAQDSDQFYSTAINDFKKRYNINDLNFGVQLQNNEIYNNFCNGLCWKQTFQEKTYIYLPGTYQQLMNNVPYNALREAGPDTNIHNLNGLLDSYQMSVQFPEMAITSSSSALGLGKIGNVGRIIDQNSLTNDDVKMALVSIQTLGIVGMSLTGLRLEAPEFVVPSQGNAYASFIRLGQILPLFNLNQISFNNSGQSNADSSLQGINYKYIARYRYNFIAYTQTQLFKSSNFGNIFIQPLFYTYPDIELAYQEIDKQFMYGPSVKVQITESVVDPDPAFFPKGTWCQLQTQREGPVQCLNLLQDLVISNQTDYVYLAGGTITPIYKTYDSNGKGIQTTAQLMNSIDLHLIIDESTKTSSGDLYMKSNQNDQQFCFFRFKYSQGSITVEDASKEMKSAQSCYDADQLIYFGDLVIYRAKDLGVQGVTVKTNDPKLIIATIINDPKNPEIALATTSKLGLKFTDIKVITVQLSQ